MKCPKCAGLMVEERYLDAQVSFYEWKCINCGLRQNIDRSLAHQDQSFARDVQPWLQGDKCASAHPPNAAGLPRPGAQASRTSEPMPATPLAA